jgi:cobalt/nickel transport system permease protein
MHMADALLSPAVGTAFWVISGALIGYSSKKIAEERDASKTPMMGVMGAFIFAAQMINFSIPGTGSSGHLGGGLLLAILLGPYRAFITLSSVLTIQCLFFADGGLLALGCNMFNLGFFPCFVGYPLIHKFVNSRIQSHKVRISIAIIIASIAGLLMGATTVVFQTSISGISNLPFLTFLLFMMPIHFAIGTIEGLATFAILQFIMRVEPKLLQNSEKNLKTMTRFAFVFILLTFITGGIVSWFASSAPDGLEWSITKTTFIDKKIVTSKSDLHNFLSNMQKKFSILPDYSFKPSTKKESLSQRVQPIDATPPLHPINIQTSISGIVGSVLILGIFSIIGFLLRGKLAKPQTGT